MGLPDFKRCIATLPDGLKCSVLDADGQAHDAAITSVLHERGPRDYGFPEFGTGDTVYVPLPFTPPKAMLTVTRHSATVRRRIENSTDWCDCLAVISLAEVIV